MSPSSHPQKMMERITTKGERESPRPSTLGSMKFPITVFTTR